MAHALHDGLEIGAAGQQPGGVELWPESEQARQLLTLPVTTTRDADGQTSAPQVLQLNTTLGARFDAPRRLSALPTWPLTAAAAAAAAGLAVTLIRTRRLELASALHAGVDRTSLLIQTGVEALGWLLTASALIAPVAWWAAVHANPDPPWSAFYPAARTTALAALSALLATLVATASTRERHLFRYFRRR